VGTSQSSSGPGAGVPMVPVWADNPTAEGAPSVVAAPADTGRNTSPVQGPPSESVEQPRSAVPVSPPGRFRGTRGSLGRFARMGDPRDLRRGMGHYVRSGYGGAAGAARRFGRTASTAGTLFAALSSFPAGRLAAPGEPLDRLALAGRSAQEVIDAVIEAVRPVDGTQDAEASRLAIRDALSDLLTRYPDADFLNLGAEQCVFVIERYAAVDVYRRFYLDVGQAICEKAPGATAALARLKEARDYIKETVAAAFRRQASEGRAIAPGRVEQVVREALRDALQVFEGYTE
jgi:hypothetical protein